MALHRPPVNQWVAPCYPADRLVPWTLASMRSLDTCRCGAVSKLRKITNQITPSQAVTARPGLITKVGGLVTCPQTTSLLPQPLPTSRHCVTSHTHPGMSSRHFSASSPHRMRQHRSSPPALVLPWHALAEVADRRTNGLSRPGPM